MTDGGAHGKLFEGCRAELASEVAGLFTGLFT